MNATVGTKKAVLKWNSWGDFLSRKNKPAAVALPSPQKAPLLLPPGRPVIIDKGNEKMEYRNGEMRLISRLSQDLKEGLEPHLMQLEAARNQKIEAASAIRDAAYAKIDGEMAEFRKLCEDKRRAADAVHKATSDSAHQEWEKLAEQAIMQATKGTAPVTLAGSSVPPVAKAPLQK